MSTLASAATKALFKVKKFSPELLTGLGVIGVIGAGVLLVRAGMKTEPVLEMHKLRTDTIKSNSTDSDSEKKDLTKAYLRTGTELAKLYAPGVLLGVVGVSAVIGGHGILRKRHIASIAAYKSVESMFKDYRGRVIDKYGEEVDDDIFRGAKIVEVVGEDGKKRKVKQYDDVLPETYGRVFSADTSYSFSGHPDSNVSFLRTQQNYLNDQLRRDGQVILNDVYERLGMPKDNTYGMVVGWKSDGTDRFIDFGIKPEEWKWLVQDIIRGDSPHQFRLDFNVDGNVYGL